MPPRGKSRPEKEGEGGVASGSDSFLKKNFFSFINSRERGREGENKGEKHQSVAPCMCPNWGLNLDQGPNPQHRHVPWPGIEPMTFQFAGWQPTHWATLARAGSDSSDKKPQGPKGGDNAIKVRHIPCGKHRKIMGALEKLVWNEIQWSGRTI